MDKRSTTISVCLILLSIGVAVAGSALAQGMMGGGTGQGMPGMMQVERSRDDAWWHDGSRHDAGRPGRDDVPNDGRHDGCSHERRNGRPVRIARSTQNEFVCR